MVSEWIINTGIRANKVKAELETLKYEYPKKFPNLEKLLEKLDVITED